MDDIWVRVDIDPTDGKLSTRTETIPNTNIATWRRMFSMSSSYGWTIFTDLPHLFVMGNAKSGTLIVCLKR